VASVGLYGVLSYTVTRSSLKSACEWHWAHRGRPSSLTWFAGVVTRRLGYRAWRGRYVRADRAADVMAVRRQNADPTTFIGAALLLAIVALLASYVPARRGASVDPVSVLWWSDSVIDSTAVRCSLTLPRRRGSS
jgi:putative ABC transport system permease protein